MTSVPSARISFLIVTLGLLCFSDTIAKADLIILKDGTVLYGKSRRESENYVDTNSNSLVTIPKGFFYVDNGPRRLYFSLKQMAEVTDHELPIGKIIVYPKKIYFSGLKVLRGLVGITRASDWDDKWNRVVDVSTEDGPTSLRQHLTVLSPYLVKMDSFTKMRWNSFYLTEELGPEKVRGLLNTHPKYLLADDIKPEDRFLRELARVDFFYQAGWYKEAEADLTKLRKTYKGKDEILNQKEKRLKKAMSRDYLKQLQRASAAGRHEWLQKELKKPDDRVSDPRAREELQLMALDYKKMNAKLEKIRGILTEQTKLVQTPRLKSLFESAVEVILRELGYENVNRLDTFLLLADELVKGNDTPKERGDKAEKLLSLAVSGWFLGNASSETSFATAMKLWEAREFLLRYVASGGGAAGSRMLREYESRRDAVTPDVMARLIEMSPPVEPVKTIPEGITERAIKGTNYLLQLPHEYNHRRRYPVLIVLHDGGQSAKDMLEEWSKLAYEHGYILVAPTWLQGFARAYTYSVEEHMKVLDTLMDLRRQFNVDDDRVFLFGQGQGGNMAMDVGLSHPDYFAGVIPMSANINLLTRRYWPNAQSLPFYVVGGDLAGDPNVQIRKQFEPWVAHGYPAIFAQYKGRGRDWFGGELPFIFSWMQHKKRHMPLTQLGRPGSGRLGDEFQTHRATDNSFYWITTDNINERYINGKNGFFSANVPIASFHARIHPHSNHIVFDGRGLKQVNIWLGRQGQVNFDNKVKVNVGERVLFWSKVKPNLRTLLEHYAERLDRGRLFVAKISLGK